MKFYGQISFLSTLLTFYSLVVGSCIDLTVSVSSTDGVANTQVVLKEDGNTKISLSKDITNENPDYQIFKEKGYELTIYHVEKKWTLSTPKYFSGRRTLTQDITYCDDSKENCWWIYQDSYCFFKN
ncbi:hypothetical protein BB559_005388 [Furculomyces boomerangus]|uniref:PLAT domain-containing protein n=2 Tax=Harpellales TaxID=61421 RepID=A0A2T9Y2U0_9FUNG|nr:hypothetical protein BB559_006450 [Furculomyces boomerangus]PVU88815.1 hypothetical protein BB559_005388 [Furculomyces boomerangus]PWA00733.1 hypothetical protein BB558_003199 [Smittium angustum]